MRPSFRPVSSRRAVLTMMLFCAAGAALADASAPATPAEKVLPTEWKPWNGLHYRLEADGHLSCYSEDSSKSKCSINPPDPAKAQPLRCNDPRWGGKKHKRTGYERADHWCNTAYANLFAEWKSYEPLGFDMQLATTPRGDVMCKSQDGTTCLPADAPATANPIDPLVCGRLYKLREGGLSTGYDNPTHWCSSPEIVEHVINPPGFSVSEAGYILTRYRTSTQLGNIATRPAWIVRFQVPELFHRGAKSQKLMIKLHNNRPWNGGERQISAELSPSTTNWMTFSNEGTWGGVRQVRLDADHRGTLSIRINESGRPEFFQAPGWPGDSFAETYAALMHPEAERQWMSASPPWTDEIDALRLDIVAHYGYRSVYELGVDPYAELTSITEILKVRTRTTPST